MRKNIKISFLIQNSHYRYNCTHKNESYCQYTFLYKDDPSLGLIDVVMDKSSVLCPVIVKPDYLGWALGIYHSVASRIR